MKKTILTVFILAALVLAGCTSQMNVTNMETSEEESIKNLLFTYEDALNAADVDTIIGLYTEDGVFMPSGAPTSVGKEQVKGAYEFVFSNIELSIDFSIDEIVVNGDYAFARTTSKGTTLIHATNETVPEENRELFILQKENGSWRIDRYMFNKMQ